MVQGAVVALGALAVAGCGVTTSDRVDRADPERVPFGLLDTDTSVAPDRGPTSRPVDLYFYDRQAQRLVIVPGQVPDTSLESVLIALQEVSATSGAPAGNPLNGSDVLRAVSISRGRAQVDLSAAFSDLTGPAQLVALAEIVFTATARPGVGQVSFTLEGEPLQVTRGDGSLTSEPVTRADYPELAPLVGG